MRFKDFEIVIHGDFESGDDELDLRSAIAKKLGGMSTKTTDTESQTVQKINDGEARCIACALDSAQYQPGCVIGKSLGEIADSSIQLIEAVVGRL